MSLFWSKKAEIEKTTHCELIPEKSWDSIPVCRDLRLKKR